MASIEKTATPLDKRAVAPGDPHSALGDRDLAEQTQVIGYRCSGNSASFSWPDPSMCPLYDFTSQGDNALEVGDSTQSVAFQVPWRLTEGFKYIGGLAEFVVPPQKTILQARLVTDDLHVLDTVATVNGDYVPLSAIGANDPVYDQWARLSTGTSKRYVRLGTGSMLVEPALPGNRRVTVRVHVAVGDTGAYGPKMFALSSKFTVRLRSLALFDVADPAEVDF